MRFARAPGAVSLGLACVVALAAGCAPRGDLPTQHEPELHPYGDGIKLLEVNCAVRLGDIDLEVGTNRGPVSWPGSPDAPQSDYAENFREFGIGAIRSHDFYGPTDWWVIFPDFAADVDAEASYDFASSDQRIAAICDAGFECLYRLGTSWKGDNPLPINDPPGTVRMPGGRVFHVADRDDCRKWARICAHVVRHYNQGWSAGHQYGIRYWEVWNEPDMSAQFWSGTPAQYFMLYEETAKALKMLKMPKGALKIGGPGLSGAFTPVYLEGFLRSCRKTGAPLDFYSWHTYGGRDEYNPYCYYEYGMRVRQALNKYGYTSAESIVTEWNAGLRDEVFSDTPAGVAYYASALMNMLSAGVSRAFQYVGDDHPMLGLHEKGTDRPVRATQALAAWKRMRETPLRVTALGSDERGYNILAGTDERGSRVQILISDYQSGYSGWALRVENLPWGDQTPYVATRWLLDPQRTELEVVDTIKGTGRTFVLKRRMSRRTICLIEIRRKQPVRQTGVPPVPRRVEPEPRPRPGPPRRPPAGGDPDRPTRRGTMPGDDEAPGSRP